MNSIECLSHQLAVLGYTGYEINELIRSVTHGCQLHRLSPMRMRRVIEVLEQHVRLGSDYIATYSK